LAPESVQASAPAPHLAFWPRGLPLALDLPRVPLTHFLDTAALRTPDKCAIHFGGQALSYRDLKRRADAVAGYLYRRFGVKRGERVLLLSQNCPQFVAAYYGILRAGAVVVPANAMSQPRELEHLLADSGARVAICAQELLPALMPFLGRELDAALIICYADALAPAELDNPEWPAFLRAPRQALDHAALCGIEDAIAEDMPPPRAHPKPDDMALLPYTSGTTGKPKGCVHTHATVVASSTASALWRALHAQSVVLGVAPMFHLLGMQGAMNVPITLGATCVMLPRWDAAQAARLIERHRVTTWSAPPAMLIDFFAHPEAASRDLSSLTVLSGGGAAMPEAVSAMLWERFGIVYQEAYGMTETASFLTANPPARCKRQCLGVPTFDMVLRVIDPETLADVAPGEVGELAVSAPQIMRGYWNNATANREAFFERDGRRFFRTGDLCSRDEDGYYFMRDRLKRMVSVSGYKVWPAEVENLLYEHPAVHEACVIGVPDARSGEAVMALLALKPGAQLHESELIAWCRERMAAYKVPRHVRVLDQLPKSTTGKIAWRALQEAERRASTEGVPA
jgi:fatty-acyl-CoA synthase